MYVNFQIIKIDNFFKFSKGQQNRMKNSVINQIKRAKWDNNYPLKKSKFTTKLYNECVNAAKKKLGDFKLLDINRTTCWAVASNEDFIPSIGWHSHHRTSRINCVYYLNIPKKMKGGQIQFKNKLGEILTLTPKDNQLLIFPGWMWHNPINVESEELRLSINMEIICDKTMEELFTLLK
jgi:hypothetical protein|tara:strand:- start:606 stop:1142 length:537 start_codon:yes stop_codon:yes gene_type:complete